MVRSSEASGNENIDRLAGNSGHIVLLGTCILRVLRPGSGKQDRFQRQRRSVLDNAAESHPGGCIPDGVHHHRDFHVQGRIAAVEPRGSVHLSDSGRIFRISQVIEFQ